MRLKTGLSAIAVAALLVAAGASPALANGISKVKGDPYRATGYCDVRAYGASNNRTEESTLGTVKIDAFGQAEYTMGVGAGCNKISGTNLFGIHVDYTWDKSNVKIATPTTTVLALPHGPEFSVTGRFGFLPTAGTVIYALAGYTWAQNDAGNMGGFALNFDGRAGLTYGGGVEVDLAQNIAAFAEYRHIDWKEDSTLIGPMAITENASTDQFRAGLLFRFNVR